MTRQIEKPDHRAVGSMHTEERLFGAASLNRHQRGSRRRPSFLAENRCQLLDGWSLQQCGDRQFLSEMPARPRFINLTATSSECPPSSKKLCLDANRPHAQDGLPDLRPAAIRWRLWALRQLCFDGSKGPAFDPAREAPSG